MPITDSPAHDPRFDRQARYISALEQLADPAPVTRLSGAQSLVWLIDEWLADETLPGPTRRPPRSLTACAPTFAPRILWPPNTRYSAVMNQTRR